MGEHKTNPVAQAAAATGKDNPNPAEVMRQLLDTPLTKEQGEKQLAEIEVQVKQLLMMRVNIDQQLAAAEFDRSVTIRRMLNKPAEKPAEGDQPKETPTPTMGEPVGGENA